MLAGLKQVLTSTVTGPVAAATALVLAVALAAATSNWESQRAHYEARIAELTRQSERAQSTLRTQLAACHAADAARRLQAANAGAEPRGARQLLEQQPEGIDACARMESADRAVLSNLKR